MNRQIYREVYCAAGAAAVWGIGRLIRARRAVNLTGRVVLITGGSRGLGLVLARHFARKGANIMLVARTQEDLQTAAEDIAQRGGAVALYACDVARREQAEAAVDRTVKRFGRLDVLVNNAGIIQMGPVDHMTQDDLEASMDIHLWATHFMTQAAIPHLQTSGEGRIVNITSIGAKVSVPHLLPYCAGKFAAAGYSDGIRAELARKGVRVTTVVPGLMRTGSHVNALFKGHHEKEYAWFSTATSLLSTSPDHAAARIVDACKHGDRSLTITLPARIAVALNGLAPGFVGFATEMVGTLLPAPVPGGDETRAGWESTSELSPTVLTRSADEQIARNNELRGREKPVHR